MLDLVKSRNQALAMPDFIKDEKGRWVGSTTDSGGRKTYLDAQGKLVARIHDGRTYDNKGVFRGYGDQGKRLLGEKNK